MVVVMVLVFEMEVALAQLTHCCICLRLNSIKLCNNRIAVDVRLIMIAFAFKITSIRILHKNVGVPKLEGTTLHPPPWERFTNKTRFFRQK